MIVTQPYQEVGLFIYFNFWVKMIPNTFSQIPIHFLKVLPLFNSLGSRFHNLWILSGPLVLWEASGVKRFRIGLHSQTARSQGASALCPWSGCSSALGLSLFIRSMGIIITWPLRGIKYEIFHVMHLTMAPGKQQVFSNCYQGMFIKYLLGKPYSSNIRS